MREGNGKEVRTPKLATIRKKVKQENKFTKSLLDFFRKVWYNNYREKEREVRLPTPNLLLRIVKSWWGNLTTALTLNLKSLTLIFRLTAEVVKTEKVGIV